MSILTLTTYHCLLQRFIIGSTYILGTLRNFMSERNKQSFFILQNLFSLKGYDINQKIDAKVGD